MFAANLSQFLHFNCPALELDLVLFQTFFFSIQFSFHCEMALRKQQLPPLRSNNNYEYYLSLSVKPISLNLLRSLIDIGS